jgi:hypothetical protein
MATVNLEKCTLFLITELIEWGYQTGADFDEALRVYREKSLADGKPLICIPTGKALDATKRLFKAEFAQEDAELDADEEADALDDIELDEQYDLDHPEEKEATPDHLDFIVRVEQQEVTLDEYFAGLAALVKDGTINGLQGSWQRAANSAIQRRIISPEGEVLRRYDANLPPK